MESSSPLATRGIHSVVIDTHFHHSHLPLPPFRFRLAITMVVIAASTASRLFAEIRLQLLDLRMYPSSARRNRHLLDVVCSLFNTIQEEAGVGACRRRES
uniref:Uncharacterized protein n=1 Tax=Oryza sativa subsp. japonica TaxID=39947 RepID=Q5Z9Z9_ORYSJ|nr:hypothetical protein [Oryza sativa Japonica Group]